MKKPLLVMVLIVLPLSFFALAYQSYEFKQKESRLADLEHEQKDLFEENKRLLGVFSRLESPDLITKRAQEEEKMTFSDQSNIIKIKKAEKP